MLLARLYPGSEAELLDWDPEKRARERVTFAHDDLERSLAQHNALRRERGLPEQSEDELRIEIADEQRRLQDRPDPD